MVRSAPWENYFSFHFAQVEMNFLYGIQDLVIIYLYFCALSKNKGGNCTDAADLLPRFP